MHFAEYLTNLERSRFTLIFSATLLYCGVFNNAIAASDINNNDTGAASRTPCLGTNIKQSIEDNLVFADGKGLPPGSGTSTEGSIIFEQRCQSCHGQQGMGATAVELVGEKASLVQPYPVKAVGSYWFAAPTLLSYIQQAMPPQNKQMDAPRLGNDESYAVVAYILSLNGLWSDRGALDASYLAAIEMPNREGFNDSAQAQQANSYEIVSTCVE